MTGADFYRAFEDRHRGPRELIRQRLGAYVPFLEPLARLYPEGRAIDLGCGRGEWLELLQERGFSAQGVDLDEAMLTACTELNLSVTRGDAIEFLAALDDESQALVSGFHIAEHIAFEQLNTLVAQAHRVLKPGGLLILETPNPENLVVGACNFFLDPTHLRPIPPPLLSFLPEYHGYARKRVVRLQEDPALHERQDIDLMSVLGGASPDYSVVAQKAAEPDVMSAFDPAFAAQYGIELPQLASRYDRALHQVIEQIGQRLQNIEDQAGGMSQSIQRMSELQDRLIDTSQQFAQAKAENDQLGIRCEELLVRIENAELSLQAAERRAEAAEALAREWQIRAEGQEAPAAQALQIRLAEIERALQEKQARIDELNGHSHHWWLQANALEQQRDSILRSWSWRLTLPLRVAGGLLVHPLHTVRAVLNHLLHGMINLLQRPLSWVMKWVLSKPELSSRINAFLIRYPALHGQLLGVARREGVVPGGGVMRVANQPVIDGELAHLSPRAKQIHADLTAAIERKRKSG